MMAEDTTTCFSFMFSLTGDTS
jgi:hypothetical protein